MSRYRLRDVGKAGDTSRPAPNSKVVVAGLRALAELTEILEQRKVTTKPCRRGRKR